MLLLALAGRRRPAAAEVGRVAAIAGYVLAVGWQPSVVRAGVAGGLASLAWLLSRPRDRWHFLALGAAVLLAWTPAACSSPGSSSPSRPSRSIFLLVPPLRRALEGHAGEVVGLALAAAHLEHRARTEGVVEPARRPGAGMDRAGDEFPERVEILEHRAVRIVVVRRGVVHVGGDPDRVDDAGMLHEREQLRDLELAAAGRAVALRDRIVAEHAERQIGGDHLPGRARAQQLALEPRQLRRAEQMGVGAVARDIAGIGAAVGAHVEHEHVEQRTVGELAVDAAGLGLLLPQRQEFVEGAAAARDEIEQALLAIAVAVADLPPGSSRR